MASLERNGDASIPPRRQPSFDQVKTSLEADFLSPPTSFSAEWLNKLQHRWDEQIDYTEITQLAPTQSRTVTRFTREGLEGRVTGYREVTVPAASANAKNSTSILRRPANRADFVRGAAGFFLSHLVVSMALMLFKHSKMKRHSKQMLILGRSLEACIESSTLAPAMAFSRSRPASLAV